MARNPLTRHFPARNTIASIERQGKSRGFTMVELMTVIAIAAIFLALATPSYRNLIASYHINTEVTDLNRDLEFARSEALKRGLLVVVCPSNDQATCTNQSTWQGGWIVMLQPSTATACSGTAPTVGTLLRVKQAYPSTDTATYAPATTGNPIVCFNRLGFVPSTNTGIFTLKTTPANTKNQRCLTVSGAGHMQILQQGQTDTNGVTCS